MKKLLLLFLSVFALCGCEHIELDDIEQSDCKDVRFIMKGISVEYSTKATLQSEGMTDLWVWEGTTLLKHQTGTDADFGMPTVSLTYGSHDLTFVASKADGQSFSSAWTCTKVKDTFAKCINVTVSGSSSSSRQVELKRRSSKLSFLIKDAIPSGVKTMHIVAGNHVQLDAVLDGGELTSYEVTADISSRVGTTGYEPVINLITASATDAEDVDVMIEFLDASGNALYRYERTVDVKANRSTVLKGNYFSGESSQVSVDTQWLDAYEVSL